MPSINGKPDASVVAALRRGLLRWYREHHRRLPWRSTPAPAPAPGSGGNRTGKNRADPYHVLVSEAMLQQTQVATVVGYFARFVAALPTVRALAEADEQAVLRLWQGLGYYRRARHLHAAARAIVTEHGGAVPDTVAGLLQLPGVGRYTAGAVASIAFARRAAVLDGNVTRVLTRLFAIDQPVDRPHVKAMLWKLAERLVPPTHPGDFNQALMELGAVICTPRRPACLSCPVSRWCRANQSGQVQRYPVSAARRAPRPVGHHVVAIEKGGAFLFEQRPPEGLWSNLWQMPTAEDLAADASGRTVGRWVARRFGIALRGLRNTGAFTHPTTHRRITFTLWRGSVASGRLKRGAGVWRRQDRIDDLPLSNPQRRAIAELRGTEASRVG